MPASTPAGLKSKTYISIMMVKKVLGNYVRLIFRITVYRPKPPHLVRESGCHHFQKRELYASRWCRPV